MEKNNNAKSKNAVNMFFSGVLVLTFANILVKSVGLISKIVLNTVVGSVGAGYYSSAYEIYAFLYIIATSGLPVALSIMVSKCRAQGHIKEARKIFNVAICMFLVIGGLFAALMIAFAAPISNVISAPETAICIVAVAPTILFICLSSCLRGFFQGYQLMKPTGISQFLEAMGKVLVGVGFAFWAKAQGYEDHVVAAFTILGVTTGVLFGMIFLFAKKIFFKDKQFYEESVLELEAPPKNTKAILKELLIIAIPITLSSCVLSLTIIIDTFMIQPRLISSGMNEAHVRVLYGDYTTLVISIMNLPTILIYPIANALVPLITAAVTVKDYIKAEGMRSFSLRIINIISIPCALGIGVFSKNILDVMMFTEDSVNRAAPWLSVGAASVIFLGLISATNTFLNTSGKQKYPIISMLCGACVKIIANYFLLPEIGIYGAPLSTVLCYLTAATLNVFFTVKHVGKLPDIKKVFGKPLMCSVVSIGFSAMLYLLLDLILPIKIATIICIFAAVLLYFFMIIRTKTILEDELLSLPYGDKIVKCLKKMHFFTKKCEK